jgi:hypothetical protein
VAIAPYRPGKDWIFATEEGARPQGGCLFVPSLLKAAYRKKEGHMKITITLDTENRKTPVHRYWDNYFRFKQNPPADMQTNPEFREFTEVLLKEEADKGRQLKAERMLSRDLYMHTLYRTEKRSNKADRDSLRKWFLKTFFEPIRRLQ